MPKRAKQLKTLKARLWKIFSEYIRLKYATPDGFVTCVTCGQSKNWKEAQAGHFLSGRNNGILFDERNVAPQCLACNVFKHGNIEEYYPWMLETYGQPIIDELRKLKMNPPKLSTDWYEGQINLYSAKVSLLKNRLGIK